MASIIDPKKAKALIKEYQKQNAAQGGPCLVTPDKQYMNGYYIDRESIEAILSNPEFTGISVYLAKHPDYVDSKENCFTICFAGAQPNLKGGPGDDPSPYTNPGDIYDRVDPCPSSCGDLSD